MYAGSVVIPCCHLATCNSASVFSYCCNVSPAAADMVQHEGREVTVVASPACCLAAGTHDLLAKHHHCNQWRPEMGTDSVSFGCRTPRGAAACTYSQHPGYAPAAAVRPSVCRGSARRGKAVAVVGPSHMLGGGSSRCAGECHRANMYLPAAAPACVSVTLQRSLL